MRKEELDQDLIKCWSWQVSSFGRGNHRGGICRRTHTAVAVVVGKLQRGAELRASSTFLAGCLLNLLNVIASWMYFLQQAEVK